MSGNNGQGNISTMTKFSQMGITLSKGVDLKKGVSMILYGASGSGKTHTINFLPPEKTVVLLFERGGDAPIEGSGIPVFTLQLEENGSGLKGFKMLVNAIQTGEAIEGIDFSQIKYVVLDHLTEMERFFITSLTSAVNKKTPTLREYGTTSYKLKEYVRKFRDLTGKGINVIMLAHDQSLDSVDSNGVSTNIIAPAVGSKMKSVNEIVGAVDVVGYLHKSVSGDDNLAEKEQRMIEIRDSDTLKCKCRYKDMFLIYPDGLPQDELGNFFKELYKVRKQLKQGESK